MAGVFSGEALTRLPLLHPEARQALSDGSTAPACCPNSPVTRRYLEEWLEAVAGMGFLVVFLDEPHFYQPLWEGKVTGAWACRCPSCQQAFLARYGYPMPQEFTPAVREFREHSLLDLVAFLGRRARERGLRTALCLLPVDLKAHGFPGAEERLQALVQASGGHDSWLGPLLGFGIRDWETAAATPGLDIVGTDPYWYLFGEEAEPFFSAYARKAAQAAARAGKGLQLWLQAFRVPAGREEELCIGARIAREVGATHLAAWSFAGTRNSDLRCERPEVVWRVLGEESRALRAT